MERLINMEQNYMFKNYNIKTLEAFYNHKKILLEEQKLQEHINIIKNEIPYVDMRTFSSNIISMELNIINSIYGNNVVDAVITFLKLDDLVGKDYLKIVRNNI